MKLVPGLAGVIVALLNFIPVYSAISSLQCTDWSGKVIKNGEMFVPRRGDPCHQCICQNGQMVMCRSVSCSAPKSCINPEPIPDKCCEFHCGDGNGPVFNEEGVTPNITSIGDNNVDSTDSSNDSITTLGLRLVASTVTSFLVLALLLFMIHRLRQKRLLQAMRRYRDNRQRERLDEIDADAFSPEFLGIRCPPYEDPPPPYTPPKPPSEGTPRDAPPPYEAIDSQNNNDTSFTPPRSHDTNHNQSNTNFSSQHEAANFSTIHHQSTAQRSNRSIPLSPSANSLGNDVDDEVATIMTGAQGCVARYQHTCPSQSQPGVEHNSRMNPVRDSARCNRNLTWLGSRGRVHRGQNQNNGPCNSDRPRNCDRVKSLYNQPSQIDYDIWDESSTASTLSRGCNYQQSRRRSYQENYARTFDESIPSYLSQHLDLDDTSTEMSSNVAGYTPVCHHRYGSLPVNSSFSSQSRHSRTLSDDSVLTSNRNCSYRSRRDTDVLQQNGLQSVDEDRKDDDDFDVSVSNFSSDHQVPVHSAPVCATNVLENDSVLELEDSNRKLEQLYDSQQLRMLRLTKLLQKPGESGHDENDLNLSQSIYSSSCGGTMCRSHSQHSGLSVCSETGEKKLSQLADNAIGNDAQYPEDFICGHHSSSKSQRQVSSIESPVQTLNHQSSSALSSNPASANLTLSGTVNSQQSVLSSAASGISLTPYYSQCSPAVPKSSRKCVGRVPSKLSDKSVNSAESMHSFTSRKQVEKPPTSEKLVQTDKKLVGKLKNKSKSQKSEVHDNKRKKHSKSGSKISNNMSDFNYESDLHLHRGREGLSVTDTKSYGFIDELKLMHSSNGKTSQDVNPNMTSPYSDNTQRRGESGSRYYNMRHNIKRSDSYSSGKSRSSSGGETSLLCPTHVTSSKRKSKVSRRNRKSCPALPSELHTRGWESMAPTSAKKDVAVE